MSKSALGRGLGALLSGSASSPRPAALGPNVASPPAADPGLPPGGHVAHVSLDRIRPCPFQPRKDFPEDALRELAGSIREQGIVQPLIVRQRADHFELIAGERRWRAAQLAGLKEVPILVRDADDTAVLELALIENLQRENLNPIEEAQGYQQLIEQFRLRQEDVADKVGKSRVAVANALRLLKLPTEIQAYLRNGELSVGHAKVVLGLAGADEQRRAVARVLKDGLNVRQTEELVTRLQTAADSPAATGPGRPAVPRDVHVTDLESRLRERFGTRVNLRYRAGRGAVEIRFLNDDELERILQTVGVTVD